MTPLVLCVVAIVTLWWPTTRAEARLAQLAPVTSTASDRSTIAWWLCCIGLPLGTTIAFGAATGAAAGMVAAFGWWRMRRRRADRCVESRERALLAALGMMISEMSVGAPAARACEIAAADIADRGDDREAGEIADGLSRMAGRARLGGDIVTGTIPARVGGTGFSSDVVEQPVWHRIAVLWQISERHGLPMLDLLAALRSDMLARSAFESRTRAGMAGPRATAMVLAGLPLLGIGLGQAMGADPLRILTGGGIGGGLLIVGTVLVLAGMMWSDRITRRVLRP